MMVDQAARLRSMIQERSSIKEGNFSRIISVASGKGGVGKTNLVVNMGIIMGQLGFKTIILDTDLGMANTDILLDLKPTHTLIDVIRGEKMLHEVLLKGPQNVELLPGGACLTDLIDLDNWQREELLTKLSYLDQEEAILLIDCSAGLSRDVLSFITSSDDLVLVTTPEPTAITDAYGIIKTLSSYETRPRIGLVVNMVRELQEGDATFQRIDSVCRKFLNMEIDYLGSIEHDYDVRKAVMNCHPYALQFPRSRVTLLTREITRTLLYGDEKPVDTEASPEIKNKNIFHRLFSLWKTVKEG
jgi:flagellar biosynthesis protein FlhG